LIDVAYGASTVIVTSEFSNPEGLIVRRVEIFGVGDKIFGGSGTTVEMERDEIEITPSSTSAEPVLPSAES
jgi:hypothetical protein